MNGPGASDEGGSSIALRELNELSEDDARSLFARCCGVDAWTREMARLRPFDSSESLFSAADNVWLALTPADWGEMFDHHPRIGEQKATATTDDATTAWSSNEQSLAASSAVGDREDLAAAQREYEARFGHIFLVCAAGRSSAELLNELRERMPNDAETELRVAAREQAKITRLRLERLLNGDEQS